ncbi:MAG: NDP-sugar synthase [bacterium]
MQAILIAGGAGTRLRPYTLATPKPLLALCGRPVMEYQIDLIKQAGLSRVIFACGVMADSIREYFGDGRDWGMRFQYAYEMSPLGTAGAIRNCSLMLDGEPTLVFNADVLTDADLGAILATHKASGAKVTLTLTPVEDPSRYGVITTDDRGRVTAFIEKPPPGMAPANTINAGIYVLEEEIIRRIPSDRAVSIERETYPGLLAAGVHVQGYVNDRYWLDIGTAESFLQAHWDLLSRRTSGAMGAGEVQEGCFLGNAAAIPLSVKLIPPVYVDAGVTFEGPCVVGPYAVLNEGVTVASDVTVSRAVALPGARVGETLEEGSIVGAAKDGPSTP